MLHDICVTGDISIILNINNVQKRSHVTRACVRLVYLTEGVLQSDSCPCYHLTVLGFNERLMGLTKISDSVGSLAHMRYFLMLLLVEKFLNTFYYLNDE